MTATKLISARADLESLASQIADEEFHLVGYDPPTATISKGNQTYEVPIDHLLTTLMHALHRERNGKPRDPFSGERVVVRRTTDRHAPFAATNPRGRFGRDTITVGTASASHAFPPDMTEPEALRQWMHMRREIATRQDATS